MSACSFVGMEIAMMDSRNQQSVNMPLRKAPQRPTEPSKYAPVVGWDDQPFSNDPFEPYSFIEKKKPPPRPPPPKINKQSEQSRPQHFNRRPTILSNLLGRKPRMNIPTEKENGGLDLSISANDIFATVSNTGSATGVLIDFSSPPSSPTFTTRSSSDGLSIDSFGSDATSSTHNHNVPGGNTSQAESGFEDDFDLFASRKPLDLWETHDPFSPPKQSQKPALPRKPALFLDKNDYIDPLCNGKTIVPKISTHKIPTIIRSKPSRPKPPDNSALLKSSLSLLSSASYTQFSAHQTDACFRTFFESGVPSSDSSPEREPSPPMPTVPPPPPPIMEDEDEAMVMSDWPQTESGAFARSHFNANTTSNGFCMNNRSDSPTPTVLNGPSFSESSLEEEPHAIALFDFPGSHSEDLPFTIGTKIKLLRKVNEEWLFGRLRSGMEGMFPASFVDIKVHPKETQSSQKVNLVKVMYDFVPQLENDLGLKAGSVVKVVGQVSDEWLLGEWNGFKGQFPANYVEYLP